MTLPDPRAWDAMADIAATADPRGPWITASWDDRCAACGERWEGGEELIRYDPDADGWVCSACGSEAVT